MVWVEPCANVSGAAFSSEKVVASIEIVRIRGKPILELPPSFGSHLNQQKRKNAPRQLEMLPSRPVHPRPHPHT